MGYFRSKVIFRNERIGGKRETLNYKVLRRIMKRSKTRQLSAVIIDAPVGNNPITPQAWQPKANDRKCQQDGTVVKPGNRCIRKEVRTSSTSTG